MRQSRLPEFCCDRLQSLKCYSEKGSQDPIQVRHWWWRVWPIVRGQGKAFEVVGQLRCNCPMRLSLNSFSLSLWERVGERACTRQASHPPLTPPKGRGTNHARCKQLVPFSPLFVEASRQAKAYRTSNPI